MAVITIIVDAPDYGTDAFSGDISFFGHATLQLIKKTLPVDDNVTLREITVAGDE